MKIVIVNGSHRKQGATALILNEMVRQLKKYGDTDVQFKKNIERAVHTLYCDINKKRKYLFQSMIHFFVFRVGILPFVMRKASQYDGVLKHWRKNNIAGGYK